MRKILFVLLGGLLLSLTSINPTTSQAAIDYKEYKIQNENYENYQLVFKLMNTTTVDYNENTYVGLPLKEFLIFGAVLDTNGIVIGGEPRWENPNYLIIGGEQNVNILVDVDGEIIIFKLTINGILNKKDIKPNVIEKEEITNNTPSLTVSTLYFQNKNMNYDINVNNKIKNSTYNWISSNENVVIVDKFNGKLTPISKGMVTILCEITTPEKELIKLYTKVYVGETYDNFPTLTDSNLYLDVGDFYDINVENKPMGSKYKWVSSNTDVVVINTRNGKLVGQSSGKAVITCSISTENNTIILLECNIDVK